MENGIGLEVIWFDKIEDLLEVVFEVRSFSATRAVADRREGANVNR